MNTNEFDYSEYIEIADGVYWVGFVDERAGLHCNPYLIVDDGEAVLIDGGSRGDFSTVMLKVMRTGTKPRDIKRLIYQHYDPDLCGNIPHLEALIDSKELKIISHHENNIFIEYYSPRSQKLCIEDMGFAYEFGNGRRLEFIRTPYSHSPGSFVTYDTKTRVLFSSDLFGSYDRNWSLYSRLGDACEACATSEVCSRTGYKCAVIGIWDFHKRVMTSGKALNYALDRIDELDVSMVAPQHGSVFPSRQSLNTIIKRLRELEHVGFDYFMQEQNR